MTSSERGGSEAAGAVSSTATRGAEGAGVAATTGTVVPGNAGKLVGDVIGGEVAATAVIGVGVEINGIGVPGEVAVGGFVPGG